MNRSSDSAVLPEVERQEPDRDTIRPCWKRKKTVQLYTGVSLTTRWAVREPEVPENSENKMV